MPFTPLSCLTRSFHASHTPHTPLPPQTGDKQLARLRDWRGKLHFKDLDDDGISEFRKLVSFSFIALKLFCILIFYIRI
jgi:hypothetical protein